MSIASKRREGIVLISAARDLAKNPDFAFALVRVERHHVGLQGENKGVQVAGPVFGEDNIIRDVHVAVDEGFIFRPQQTDDVSKTQLFLCRDLGEVVGEIVLD